MQSHFISWYKFVMTFPKASVKLEKPPFLRGLRWKITVAFIVLFFALLAVLGPLGAAVEYAFLNESFKKSGTMVMAGKQ